MRFDEFVNENGIPLDVLQEAARLSLAEEIDDLEPNEMRRQLAEVVGEKDLDAALRWLEANPSVIENASVAYLAETWNELSGEKRVRSAVDDASAAMPVLEMGIAAIAAMYITWLFVTGGKATEDVQEEETTTAVTGERSIKRVSKKTFWGPTGPLRVIVDLFRAGGGDSTSGPD
jgi:hypothetical protein